MAGSPATGAACICNTPQRTSVAMMAKQAATTAITVKMRAPLLSCAGPKWTSGKGAKSFSLKGCIHNLLNEEYETVLSRPMPRLNVSFFLGITPKFRKR